jgi:uncharacterized protein YfbU (UPF0304 family)
MIDKNNVVITARIDSDLKKQLDDYSRQKGLTRSEVITRSLAAALADKHGNQNSRGGSPEQSWGNPLPIYGLDPASRRMLILLNSLAAFAADHSKDGQIEGGRNAEDYRRAIEALQNGYNAEYESVLPVVYPDLTIDETDELNDVFEMFRLLLTGYADLEQKEKDSLPKESLFYLHCRGFDFNDSYEYRLYEYSKFLAADDRWSDVFEDMKNNSDGGNSHSSMLRTYRIMLDRYRKVESSRRGLDWSPLTFDEVKGITTPYGIHESDEQTKNQER